MKIYLSSYKFGNDSQKLADMVGGNKKIAVVSNSRDYSTDIERRKTSEETEIAGLKELGLDAFSLDLRDYFDKKDDLEKLMDETDAVWILGGNTFVLRVAMKKSGLDEILKNKKSDKNFVYAGYSAGGCILYSDLKIYSMTDEPEAVEVAYPGEEIIWEGLGFLDFVFEPHYKSDHPESESTSKEIEQLIDDKILFRAFRDGEVYITEI